MLLILLRIRRAYQLFRLKVFISILETGKYSDRIAVDSFHPCNSAQLNIYPEIRKCCDAMEYTFSHVTAKQIMDMMKYSLEISDPLIPKYINRNANMDNSYERKRKFHLSWFSNIQKRYKSIEKYVHGWK